MRKIALISMLFVALYASAQNHCGSSKKEKLQGIEMVETLSDDGLRIIKMPFKWFAGFGEADDKQLAIEIAQREAQATVSRLIRNEILDQAAKVSVDVNGRVCQALITSWEQYSHNILIGCEPFGDTEIKYNSCTGMYAVKAKIGIQGDRFKKMMNEYKERIPEELTPVEVQQFIQINQTVVSVIISE